MYGGTCGAVHYPVLQSFLNGLEVMSWNTCGIVYWWFYYKTDMYNTVIQQPAGAHGPLL